MFSFLSIEFALGFIAFFCVYWAFQSRPHLQNYLLTLASYAVVYAMASTAAVVVLATFSFAIYAISRFVQTSKSWYIFGLILTVLHLCFWKYFDFFKNSTDLLTDLVLPLGISYYSFQAISYLTSCYQHTTTRLNLRDLLFHFSFFATISAGPIARVQNAKGLNDIYQQPCGIAQQLHTPRKILSPTWAFVLILLALIKKWWLAGWIADSWVNPVFSNPLQYQSLEILSAIYGYTLQLFLDFSGYSEMMIAFGLLLGFRLPVNFKAPLLAHNIRDFWDRWHISLSTWIRDYIYIPLGGSKKGFGRTQLNLIIAMALSGLWHGSGLHFMFWGLLHGSAIVLLNIADRFYNQRNAVSSSGLLGKILSVFVTFNFVCFCFVFFRAKNLDEALQVFQALFANTHHIAWSSNPLYFLSLLIITAGVYPFAYKKFLQFQQYALPHYRLSIPLFMCFLTVLIFAPSGIPGFIYANF
ncbi:MBOAT family O-acyltransferase [Acinetobacter sp. HY1485]|uniref:MBOAT family O-acyltransferase n=1 Tax=Acinetobacter sp. HY1485 TaxID=2970918 RepID=UPI0022B9D0D6|nr:MBOAT family O-acyltransferase [Acinetobacter sp. HY1485]